MPAQHRGRAVQGARVPLVVAPTTITDSKGHFADGLRADDLILYDNNVPQKIQMDWTTYPIDLVVAVQTSTNSGAVIDKLGGSGILFAELLAADAGQTAVISSSDDVKIHQEFTGDPDLVTRSLRTLHKEGDQAHMLDALHQALLMLEQRPPVSTFTYSYVSAAAHRSAYLHRSRRAGNAYTTSPARSFQRRIQRSRAVAA